VLENATQPNPCMDGPNPCPSLLWLTKLESLGHGDALLA